MTTTQDAFHPLRGHMQDGCQISMSSGDILTLRAVMGGWELRRADGSAVAPPSADARVITDQVVGYQSGAVLSGRCA